VAKTVHALTIWQPWAWAIIAGHKPVENRTWPCPKWMLGARLAIHAGMRYDPAAERFVCERLGLQQLPPEAHAQGVLGLVTPWRNLEQCSILATGGSCSTCHHGPTCAKARDPIVASGWLTGPIGWALGDRLAFEKPIPCRGLQGLWVPEQEVLAEIERQVSTLKEVHHG